MTIPGVQQRTAEVLIAEIATDMSAFPTAAHLASGAGICPGNDQSAGKRRSGTTRKDSKWLRVTLTEASPAATRKQDTHPAARYQRPPRRRGHSKALTAVSHSILTAARHKLITGETYREAGADDYTRQNPDRATRNPVRRLQALRHHVTIQPREAAA